MDINVVRENLNRERAARAAAVAAAKPIPTQAAAALLGISDAQFLRLAKRLSLSPASVRNRASSGPAYLWDPVEVGRLLTIYEEIAAVKVKVKKRKDG